MSIKMRRTLWIIGITMALISSLLMASCGATEEVPITVPAGAQAGDLVDLEHCTYEARD